jgi:hypothetical protein
VSVQVLALLQEEIERGEEEEEVWIYEECMWNKRKRPISWM